MLTHRALVTNEYLYKCNIKDTDKCYFCGEFSETIEHLFWNCNIIRSLWMDFIEKLLPYINLKSYLEKKYVMFCIQNEENRLVNHLFILVKRYIYVTRCREKDVSLHSLLVFVKKYYVIETNIEASTYNCSKWDPVQKLFN